MSEFKCKKHQLWLSSFLDQQRGLQPLTVNFQNMSPDSRNIKSKSRKMISGAFANQKQPWRGNVACFNSCTKCISLSSVNEIFDLELYSNDNHTICKVEGIRVPGKLLTTYRKYLFYLLNYKPEYSKILFSAIQVS